MSTALHSSLTGNDLHIPFSSGLNPLVPFSYQKFPFTNTGNVNINPISIGNLAPGIIYKMVINFVQVGAPGYFQIAFNNDNSARYNWHFNYAYGSTGSSSQGGTDNNGGGAIPTMATGNTIVVGSTFLIECTFQTMVGNDNGVTIGGFNWFSYSSGNWLISNWGGNYFGVNPLFSVQLQTVGSGALVTGSTTVSQWG
jgi:hypothetical protein